MELAIVAKAIGMFAVTNIDDIVILTLFFGQTSGRSGALRVAAGQYLGFGAILAAAVVGAAGAGLLPESAVPYLGLLPLALGVRAGWRVWSAERNGDAVDDEPAPSAGAPGLLGVAAVTFANGGDNIGVYLPVFATTDARGVVTYCTVFLVMVGLWCALGHFLATRSPVARLLSRWGHIVLPVVLVGIGLAILIDGGAFGL